MKRIFACAAAALTLAILTGFLAGCGTNPVYESPKPPPMTGNFYYPMGITYLGDALYISDTNNNTIRKVDLLLPFDANISTVAGTAGMPGALDETGAAARFYSPAYLTTDNTYIFVAGAFDRAVRKIELPGAVVSTYEGTLGVQGTTDDVDETITALFTLPQGIVMLGGNTYVLDRVTDTLTTLRVVDASKNTTTATLSPAEPFNRPYGITACNGDLYVANMGDATILKIVPGTWVVTTLAGTAGEFGSVDAVGPDARFLSPTGITCVADTDLYITDTGNNTIRKVAVADGAVTTVAGLAGVTGFTDGAGSSARFKYPFGIATDGTDLYVTDTHNHIIRKIDVSASYDVTTIAGTPGEPGSIDTVVIP